MNENHKRHLLSTFQYVDNLLSEAERILASDGSPSPFQEYAPDSTPVQRKVTRDYIARIRDTMRHILGELGIPQKPPVCGALWAARGHLDFAGIAVAELEPKHMRGYGQFSEEDARRFENIVAEMNAAIDRVRSFLARDAEQDLQARLARLETTTDEIKLLRELERVVTAHGLVEFRGTLTALLERLENHAFEIGVFGRVSSGKSSLLNHLLESEVLPVGVTPVTSFPTRVSFGATARAVVEFADTKPQTIRISQLAEFATEQQNPGNAKHVARVKVEFPARRLRSPREISGGDTSTDARAAISPGEGVTFVDTPGLGSLATTGAEETVAYLPRCDLGIVLIDAASTLTHEDLAVVQALYQSGAKAMVLVSKADLLGEAERRQTTEYVQRQLATQANLNLPVHLVSVVGESARLCDDWLEKELMPLVEAHREQAADALKRKVGGLRETVIKVLESRLGSGHETPATASGRGVEDALTGLRKADVLIETAERDGNEIMDEVTTLADEIISVAASDLAAAWIADDGMAVDALKTFSVSVNRSLTVQVANLTELFSSLRSQLDQTLQLARQVLPAARDDLERLPTPAGAPVADLTTLTQGLFLKRPALLSSLGTGVLRRHTRQRLETQLDRSLPEFLSRYRAQLREWFWRFLAELREAFSARAGVYRAQLDLRATSSAAPTSAASLQADLQILRNWPS